MASITSPVYGAKIVTKTGTVYEVKQQKKGICEEISLSHGENELAQRCSLSMVNIKQGGKLLKDLVDVIDQVYITADTGNGPEEKFRGPIWTQTSDESDRKTLSVTAYDNLIYLQNSKDEFFFPAGQNTRNVIQSIFDKWGIPLSYDYETITHPKLFFRSQNISNTIIEVLDAVKKQTGVKYVIYSDKGTAYIKRTGSNTTVYGISRKENAGTVKETKTVDGMVTKVVITGKQDDEGRSPVLATVDGDTATYGTLQAMISKDEDTSMEESRKEAEEILKEKGKPFLKRYIDNAVDNPNIRKGDTVSVETESVNGKFVVLSIEHSASSGIMNLEVGE